MHDEKTTQLAERSAASRTITESDRREIAARLSTFGRLCSAFPTSRAHNLDLTIQTYIDATYDVPVRWLEAAVRKLIRSRQTDFLPTVGRVLGVVATEARSVERRAKGQHPTHGDTGPLKPVTDDRVDEYVAKVRAWEGLPALPAPNTPLALPSEVEERVRAIANGNGARRPSTHAEPF